MFFLYNEHPVDGVSPRVDQVKATTAEDVAVIARYYPDTIYFEAELVSLTKEDLEFLREFLDKHGNFYPYHCVDCIEMRESEALGLIEQIVDRSYR